MRVAKGFALLGVPSGIAPIEGLSSVTTGELNLGNFGPRVVNALRDCPH